MQHEVRHILDGIVLIALTVAIHSGGALSLLIIFLKVRQRARPRLGYVHNTLVITVVVLALLLCHLIEVGLWAAFYYYKGCLQDPATAIYFSLETYATVGYGDVVLGKEWRLLGGVEALVGVLMMSWSTAVLIGLVNWFMKNLLDRWGLKESDL